MKKIGLLLSLFWFLMWFSVGFSINNNHISSNYYSWTYFTWSVSWSLDDWENIEKSYYYVKDSNWDIVLSGDIYTWSNSFDYTWDLSSLSDWRYVSNVFFQVSWSIYTWQDKIFYYDKTAPNVSEDSIVGWKEIDGKIYLSWGSIASLNMKVKENLTTWTVIYMVNDTEKEPVTLNVGEKDYNLEILTWDLIEWENTIKVTLEDGAWNETGKEYTVYYDKTAPNVSEDSIVGWKEIDGKIYLSWGSVASLNITGNENLTTWDIIYSVNWGTSGNQTLNVWTKDYSFSIATW